MIISDRNVILGCVADDDSGGTDEGGMLTARNVRTVLFIDLPSEEALRRYAKGFEAVIITTGARSATPRDAYRKTAAAIKLLQSLHPDRYQIKYCSTFDSTEKGNIGPSIEAAMDTLKVKSTVVVPALPVNGRTTYMGYHFVNGRLISDSPMKDHPLNPMRNPDLVNFLQRQTRRKVGLVPYDVVKLGSRRLRGRLRQLEADGLEMIVVDAVEQKHLTTIFRAVENDLLITGGSGIAMEIPGRLSKETSVQKAGLTFDHVRLRKGTQATLVVAGSCSPATLRQNVYAQQHGFKVLRLEAEKILDGDHTSIQTMARLAVQYLHSGQNVLVHSTGDRPAVEQIQRAGRARGWSTEKVGRIITDALARITRWILDHGRVNKLIVAGGETSGHICRKLRLTALEVGSPIDPGVPYCFSLEKYELALVLKSGNFGEEDFYVRAANILTQLTNKTF